MRFHPMCAALTRARTASKHQDKGPGEPPDTYDNNYETKAHVLLQLKTVEGYAWAYVS